MMQDISNINNKNVSEPIGLLFERHQLTKEIGNIANTKSNKD